MLFRLNNLLSVCINRLFKEGIWIVIGQAMAMIGALVGVRLLTELLEPAVYGELALGMTMATMVNQVVFGPLSNGATRFYAPAVEQGQLNGYFTAVRRLVLLATGFVLLIVLVVILGLCLFNRAGLITIASVAMVFAILSGYNVILNGMQNAARQRSIVAFHQGVEPWARFLIAAVLIIVFGATSATAMAGYLIALTLVLGSQYVFFRKNSSAYEVAIWKKRNWQRDIWKFSWPFASWGLFTWAQLASDRWALGLLATTQDVGLYAVLFQLGYYPMSMASGMAMQLLAPIFYQRAGDGNDILRNANVNILGLRLTSFILMLTIVIFGTTLPLHKQIFGVLVANKYLSVSYLLPWMLLASGIFAAGQAITINLASQMRTTSMVKPKILTAVLGTILNFYGAYMYGTAGIVSACVLFSVVYFCWMLFLLFKG